MAKEFTIRCDMSNIPRYNRVYNLILFGGSESTWKSVAKVSAPLEFWLSRSVAVSDAIQNP